ncbi:AsnC family transcriptional regulator [Methanocella arvoryzae]|uniref:Transcription regulator (AsnC/Lrp family) n=1 Tax=Methanocella arvoryzae (strain DSM 22066 / NBRC 105507 / MRE50) TaxID=351160 RepID=Q0W5K3_METAR|nr:AsnC family transcriptional regulator [Methanocella arvoryzae]CAJ36340.1 putative transcription regulator (AsnC/Lrp family) [Methanocella arvoryzae MRE50]
MDALDFRILGLLLRNARLSYESMAAELGVSEGVIINRVFLMWDAGVISEYRTRVSPLLFGCRPAIVLAEAYRSYCKQKDVRALRTVDRITQIVETTSKIYSAYVLFRDDQDLRDTVDLIRAKVSPSRITSILQPHEPVPSVQLTGQDWKIVEYLMDDPRAAEDKMARDLGVPERSLNRRMEKLLTGGAFSHTIVIQPGMFQGMTSNRLYIVFKGGDEHDRKTIVDSIENKWNMLRLDAPDGVVIDVYGKTRKDIYDDLKNLKSHEAVGETFYTLPSRIVSNDLLVRRKVIEAVFSTDSLRGL